MTELATGQIWRNTYGVHIVVDLEDLNWNTFHGHVCNEHGAVTGSAIPFNLIEFPHGKAWTYVGEVAA